MFALRKANELVLKCVGDSKPQTAPSVFSDPSPVRHRSVQREAFGRAVTGSRTLPNRPRLLFPFHVVTNCSLLVVTSGARTGKDSSPAPPQTPALRAPGGSSSPRRRPQPQPKPSQRRPTLQIGRAIDVRRVAG